MLCIIHLLRVQFVLYSLRYIVCIIYCILYLDYTRRTPWVCPSTVFRQTQGVLHRKSRGGVLETSWGVLGACGREWVLGPSWPRDPLRPEPIWRHGLYIGFLPRRHTCFHGVWASLFRRLGDVPGDPGGILKVSWRQWRYLGGACWNFQGIRGAPGGFPRSQIIKLIKIIKISQIIKVGGL